MTQRILAAWLTVGLLLVSRTAADDTLPKRLLEEPAKTGPAQGRVNELSKMLPAYYAARGWSADGRPTNETLARLGI